MNCVCACLLILKVSTTQVILFSFLSGALSHSFSPSLANEEMGLHLECGRGTDTEALAAPDKEIGETQLLVGKMATLQVTQLVGVIF